MRSSIRSQPRIERRARRTVFPCPPFLFLRKNNLFRMLDLPKAAVDTVDAIGITYRRHGVRVCTSDGDSAAQLVERESRLPLDDDPPCLFIVALLRLNCYSVLAPRDVRHARIHTRTHGRTRMHTCAEHTRPPHRSIDTIWTVDTYTTQIIFIMTIYSRTLFPSYCYVKEEYLNPINPVSLGCNVTSRDDWNIYNR